LKKHGHKQAPSANDEFIILPYHVHAISEIQAGLAKTTELNATETALIAEHNQTQTDISNIQGISETDFHNYQDSYGNKDTYKANVAGVSRPSDIIGLLLDEENLSTIIDSGQIKVIITDEELIGD
jgi:hypothetical protein